MQVERSNFEDGFSSNDEGQEEGTLDLLKVELPTDKQIVIPITVNKIDPPQEIKQKSYSLQPDISMGWAPKIQLPRPVPLTFPDETMHRTLTTFKTLQSQIELCYLGPQFNNTYSAWKKLNVDFPYRYLGEKPITLTNRSFVGKSPSLREDSLLFQSMFESGNLDAAFKVDELEYDCFMRVDANTRGHLQWYYFQVSRMQPFTQYQFNICNFEKGKTLYTRGMKPYVLSMRANKQTGSGWQQAGDEITYSKGNCKLQAKIQEKTQYKEQKYFKLSFKLSTTYEDDVLEIAYCVPYTYTRLISFISNTLLNCKDRNFIHEENLCLSFGGFKVPLLTITNQVVEEGFYFKSGKPFKNKRLIFIMARIHPGQSNGSFMAEGFINWLCGSSPQSNQLRDRFVFKIIPMANPDGVVIGNYRTGLTSRDFNREFLEPQSSLFVETYHIKKYIQQCKYIYQKQFNLFLDFHGHTVKKNVFTYGPEFSITSSKYYDSRLLPKLVSRRTSLFRYYSCVFKVTPSKEATARAVVLRQLGISFAFTFEASNGSYYDSERLQDMPFNAEKWVQVGAKVCESVHDYWLLQKQIEENRDRKKREKEILSKLKQERSKRIQSSFLRYPVSSSSQRSKARISIKDEIETKEHLLKEIFTDMKCKENEHSKCSDDELSEGKSDSQNQKDDFTTEELKELLFPTPKKQQRLENITIEKRKSYSKVIKILKRGPFVNAFEEYDFEEKAKEKEKKIMPSERLKKNTIIRKKINSMHGNTPSPVKQSENTAKIINISFILNPISTVNSFYGMAQDRNRKTRTQIGDLDFQSRSGQRQEATESYRKTFLSLQRDILKKEIQRKVAMNANFTGPRNFRSEEIVGKRIYTQTNL